MMMEVWGIKMGLSVKVENQIDLMKEQNENEKIIQLVVD
jgi:hypothetical protein